MYNQLHKTRDAVLGEENILNIEAGVHVYSSKHATLSVEEKNAAAKLQREQITQLLEDDSRLQEFHNALLQLDHYIDNNTPAGSLAFAQNEVLFNYQDIQVRLYLFQVGYIRFIKEIAWGV